MNYNFDVMSPPQKLAIAYAKPQFKAFLATILAFDSRLKEVAERSTEPLIGQLKLAWWRDGIHAEPENRPRGEPIFAQLNALEGSGQVQFARDAMIAILDGWELLIANDDDVVIVADAFVDHRARGVFGGFAAVSGINHLELVLAMGRDWARADMGWSVDGSESSLIDRRLKVRDYRALTILSKAAQLETTPSRLNGAKLIWHALTGR